jgi:hypothetical protein
MSGAAVAPWWIPVLDAAIEWNMKPWEIAGGHQLQWYARWKARRDAHARVDKAKK